MSNINGVGILGLLELVFIVLKLTDVISWSWWIILMPFYISLFIVLLVIFIVIFIE